MVGAGGGGGQQGRVTSKAFSQKDVVSSVHCSHLRPFLHQRALAVEPNLCLCAGREYSLNCLGITKRHKKLIEITANVTATSVGRTIV
jgi:hypothetical protein